MDKTQKLIAEALELTCGNLTDLAAEAETSRQALYSWEAGDHTPSTKKLAKLYFTLAARTRRLEHIVRDLSEILLERSPEYVRPLLAEGTWRHAVGVVERAEVLAKLKEMHPPEESE